MKTILSLTLILFVATNSACTDNQREAEKAKADADAKARAEAAKKEMETLPKVFRSRNIFEKNEPAKTETKSAETTPAKKS